MKNTNKTLTKFARAWPKNKNTYFVIGGLLFLLCLSIFYKSYQSLQTIKNGVPFTAKVTRIIKSATYRSRGSTTIHFLYEEDGHTKEGEIQIYLNPPIKTEDNIKVLKNKKTGIFVTPNRWEYYYGIMIAVITSLFSLAPYYYHFFIYRKLNPDKTPLP